ncbi:hypothetical protein FHX34_105451 [Actinoplanes teichomyceticus]|uniref:Uncharacterized protein n=1 Tax=Actinoplanes teichomyceticus TaxID=1867 RepID=A0A561VLU0_ACTTI|nr:hypothetical protein FHX34_105451 [Actinoplanes teichomyceticus]
MRQPLAEGGEPGAVEEPRGAWNEVRVLSSRVATERHCSSRLKQRSTTLRCR